MNWISNLKIGLKTDIRSCIRDDLFMTFDLYRFHRHLNRNVKTFSIHLSVKVCYNYLHPVVTNLLYKITKFLSKRGIPIQITSDLEAYLLIMNNKNKYGIRECLGTCHLTKLFSIIDTVKQTSVISLQKSCQIVIASCLSKTTDRKYVNVPSKLLEHLDFTKCPIGGFIKHQQHFYERKPLIISCCDNLFSFKYFYLPKQLPLLIVDYLKDFNRWNRCLSYDPDSVKHMLHSTNIKYCKEHRRKHGVIGNEDPFILRFICAMPNVSHEI